MLTGLPGASKSNAEAGGGGGGAAKKKSVWTNSTKVGSPASKNSRNNTFSPMDTESMTSRPTRDTPS